MTKKQRVKLSKLKGIDKNARIPSREVDVLRDEWDREFGN